MNKVKKLRFISIFALAALMALTLVLAIGSMPFHKASAATTHNPDSVFTAGSNGAVSASEAGEGQDSFVQFKLENGGKAHFRRDLALKWYEEVKVPASDGENEGETEGEEEKEDNKVVTPDAKLGYFYVTFAFPEVNFEKFTLTFVSAQESVDKEEKTTNSLIFTAKDGKLALSVKNGENDAIDSENAVENPLGDITVSFMQEDGDDREGAFTVLVNNMKAGKFTNIGGYYMEYSTSRDPLTFTAEGGALAAETDAKSQLVLVKEMNNQSLKLNENGMVSDDTDPVLVVNEVVRSFPLGQKFSLSCKLIDVCGTSRSLSTITSEYYMYKAPAEGESEVKPEYKSLSTSTYFMPVAGNEEKAEEFVSIRFRLDDGRTLGSNETRGYAYLSWYVDSNLITTHNDTDYIIVNRNSEGPTYTTVIKDVDGESVADTSEAAIESIEQYRKLVEESSKDLNAGSGAYFYLPSLRDLIVDDNTDYRNLKFTVYYKDQTSSSAKSATSLEYNKLKIEISKKGIYSFRVVATDKLGNSMQLMQDGVPVAITSGNVWDFDCIPQFEFVAHSKGVEIEKPDAPAKGYLDGAYTVESFDIVAIDGYKSEYKLYYFEQDKYVADGNTMPAYDAMVENPEKYAVDKYVTEIRAYDDSVSEDDETAWARTDNDYYWRPSSRTFRPQKTGYYFVKIEVTDVDYFNDVQSAYQVVEVSNNIDEIKGETYWLQNNITAVVLFAISGVLAIALVVLIFIKPSEKKVEEVDLGKLKGKKRK